MKSQKGQALVETALIIPILIALLFGITDFGRVFHVYLTLDHAGREAGRTAAIGSTDDDIRARIINASSGLDKGELLITISPEGEENRVSGSDVQIKLSYPFKFLTPGLGKVISDFKVENITVMRVE